MPVFSLMEWSAQAKISSSVNIFSVSDTICKLLQRCCRQNLQTSADFITALTDDDADVSNDYYSLQNLFVFDTPVKKKEHMSKIHKYIFLT